MKFQLAVKCATWGSHTQAPGRGRPRTGTQHPSTGASQSFKEQKCHRMCKSREGTEPLLRARWGPEASARLLCQRNNGCLCASPENPQAWASPWGTFHFCMSLLLPAPHFHPKAFKVILTCRGEEWVTAPTASQDTRCCLCGIRSHSCSRSVPASPLPPPPSCTHQRP